MSFAWKTMLETEERLFLRILKRCSAVWLTEPRIWSLNFVLGDINLFLFELTCFYLWLWPQCDIRSFASVGDFALGNFVDWLFLAQTALRASHFSHWFAILLWTERNEKYNNKWICAISNLWGEKLYHRKKSTSVLSSFVIHIMSWVVISGISVRNFSLKLKKSTLDQLKCCDFE